MSNAQLLEFMVPERPVSQQARRRERVREWRSLVATHARAAAGPDYPPIERPVALRLLFVYQEVALDVDNILKPIQDALVGVVLQDDGYVTDVEIRRRARVTRFLLGDVSPALAAGLESGGEFVYIAITEAPPQDVLP